MNNPNPYSPNNLGFGGQPPQQGLYGGQSPYQPPQNYGVPRLPQHPTNNDVMLRNAQAQQYATLHPQGLLAQPVAPVYNTQSYAQEQANALQNPGLAFGGRGAAYGQGPTLNIMPRGVI